MWSQAWAYMTADCWKPVKLATAVLLAAVIIGWVYWPTKGDK